MSRASRSRASSRPRNPSRAWLEAQATAIRPWHRRTLGFGLLAALATLVQLGGLAWIVAQAVIAKQGIIELWPALLMVALALILRAAAQWGQEVSGQACGLAVKRAVRAQLLAKLHALGPVRLASRHSAGLASQLVDQVESLEGYYARFRPQVMLALAVPLLYLAVVLWLNWLAAVWLLIAAPLIPLFMALIGMGAQRLNEAQFRAVTRLSGHFLDRVRGITTLQLFGLGERATAEVSDVAHDYRRRSMRTLRVAFLSSAVLEFFAAVSVAVVAIYIGLGLLGYIDYGPAGELDLFSGLFILLLAPEFFQPLRTLSQHYHDRASALGAAEGLMALLDEPVPETAPASAPTSSASVAAAVELDAVELSHVGRQQVLGPLSLRVETGEVVALIGPSGSGKSSLLQLIAGFVAADRGRVSVAPGAAIAWLDQRPLIIQGTLAENLRLVAPSASDTALHEALEEAGLGDWMRAAAHGLETPLGERGVGLSGGEGQRLALARIFLSPARLVLLDEPTAALDPETERAVVTALQRLAASGRTLLVATHHPALMAMADRVLALDGGRLVSAPGTLWQEALNS